MSRSTQKPPSLAQRVARWWRAWVKQRGTMAALADCGPAEIARMARDIGVSGAAELRVLAGKWPNSSDLLSRRLQQFRLDPTAMMRAEPDVVRDLERVCTLCTSRRRCSRDFAAEEPASAWETYCPNAPTLGALIADSRTSGP
jgi:hypothetical protein